MANKTGCGKTTIGNSLAAELGAEFQDGDWFHTHQNRDKMSKGIALTDEDRLPWLQALARNLLRECEQIVKDKVHFVHLVVPEAVLLERLTSRQEHYFPPQLLTSQLSCLESPRADEVIYAIENTQSAEQIVQLIIQALNQ